MSRLMPSPTIPSMNKPPPHQRPLYHLPVFLQLPSGKMAKYFMASGIGILHIQEHRRVCDDPAIFSRVEGQFLITSSAQRNQTQAAVGGVGLVLSPWARKALIRVTPLTDRILLAEFEDNPITVIVIYSPTNASPHSSRGGGELLQRVMYQHITS